MPAVFLHFKNIWLHWVLVVAHRIFLVVACGTFFSLSCGMRDIQLWHADLVVVCGI